VKAPANRLARDATRFGAATMLSRLLGLVREQMFAALVGAGLYADAFVVAFRIPNLLRDLFAEGALSAAFVPTFTDYLTNRRSEAWALANRVVNAILVLLGTLVLIGEVFSRQLVHLLAGQFSPEKTEVAARLTQIMLPFLPLVSLAAVAMGMLTSQNRFGAPALAPTMFNVLSIAVGAVLWAAGVEPSVAVVGWSVGTLLGGLAQLLIQVPPVRRTGWRYTGPFEIGFEDPGVRRIARLMGPATVGLAATQVNIVVNTYFASGVTGAPAWLSYAFRLMQLPIGVFGVAIATVSMAGVAQRAAAKDMAGLNATVGTSLRLVAFLTVPSTAALAVLGVPIIRLIYQHGRFHADATANTALALVWYSVGLYAYAAVKVVAPAFYALDRSRVPLIASVLAVAGNIGLNASLFPVIQTHYGAPAAGAALALGTSVAALTNFGVLIVAFKYVGGDLTQEGLWRHLGKVSLASAAGAWIAWQAYGMVERLWGHMHTAERLVAAFGPLVVGGGVYLVLAWALQVAELEMLISALRRRLCR
jgi:putative peptidoglycan lipid II flippase